MKPIHWLAPAVFLACATAGWLTRGETSEGAPTSADAAPPTKASQRERRTKGRGAMPEDVRQQLAPILAARDPKERMRATLELAHRLPVSEMERWYRADWFDFHDDMEANLFFRITRTRWLEEDPQGLMRYFLENGHDKTSEMAGLWAKRDPEQAFDFLEGLEDHAQIRSLLYPMSGSLAAADPARALAAVSRLHGMLGAQNTWEVSELVAGIAKHHPDLLERESAAWPAQLREIAVTQVARAALQRDFMGGVTALQDLPDGKRRFLRVISNGGEIAKEMVKHADRLPPGWFAEAASESPYYVVNEKPGEWIDADYAALGFTDDQAKRMLHQAYSYLGSKDPDRALALLEADELDDNLRSNLLSNTLSHLARKDPERAEAFAARLTDPNEIAQARNAIDSASSPTGNPAPPPPAEWLAGLAEKEEGSLWQYTRHLRQWDKEQMNEVVQQFTGLEGEQKDTIARRLSDPNQSEIPVALRAEAISHLLSQPQPEPGGNANNPNQGNPLLRSASQLASSWGREDPLSAGRWVRGLPSGEERTWAAKNLAVQWAEYDPAGARQWAASLPAAEKTEILTYLENGEGNRH